MSSVQIPSCHYDESDKLLVKETNVVRMLASPFLVYPLRVDIRGKARGGGRTGTTPQCHGHFFIPFPLRYAQCQSGHKNGALQISS